MEVKFTHKLTEFLREVQSWEEKFITRTEGHVTVPVADLKELLDSYCTMAIQLEGLAQLLEKTGQFEVKRVTDKK